MKIKIFLIILFFLFLGILFSYPLILNFNSSIPYTHAPASGFAIVPLIQGDHLLLYYTYWLIKDYFLTPWQQLLREPYVFNIQGWPRPYEPRGLPSSLLFLIFSFFGNIPAYNIMIILSFLLCGIFSYLLFQIYLKNTFASIVGGIIFTVSPFRLAQLFGGHPTGFILFWIPLIVYLYELLWQKRKWVYGWLAGISIFCMCMEEHHMGYYTALFTIVFWLYKYFFSKTKVNIPQFIWLVFPVAIGWITVGLYMFYIKSIVFNTSIATKGRTFDEIKLYAPIMKNIFQQINPDSEKYIYIGIIPACFFIAGLIKRVTLVLKNKLLKDNFPYLFYFITFSFSLLLSLGPNLKYLPIYKLCYKIIPFFNFPRSPARMYMFTLLALSLLSGYGVKYLLYSFKGKWPRYALLFCSVLLLYPNFHPGLCKLTGGNKTYDYIKTDAKNNPLLEIPLWPGDSSWTSIYQYYTTIYRIPIINGYSPFVTQQYIDSVFWPLVSINMGMINEKQYNLLKSFNIRYINLHEEAYPQKVNPFPFKIALENLKKSPYLKFIIKDGPIYLFLVLDKPLEQKLDKYTIPSKTGVFYECENMPHRIGEIAEDIDASGNKSLYAKPPLSEPVHLIFGPWQLFPPGKYKILFRIKKLKDTSAALEVTTDKGETQIVSRNLNNMDIEDKYTDYILHFTIDKLTELEFRIKYSGGAPIWADYIYLLCEEENDPQLYYAAEDLFHIGRVKDNAVFATPELDPSGNMIFGPYRLYPAGKYRIGFRLKAGEKLNSESAKLKISISHNDKPLTTMPLGNISTEFKTYWIDLSLTKPEVLEFQVEFLRKVPIYVDSIEISLC